MSETTAKHRAKIEILSYICAFSTSRTYGDDRTYGGSVDCSFSCRDFSSEKPQIGSLVALAAAPVSKFYLAWLIDMREANKGWPEYLLESIEDGSTCWWGNVGIYEYDRSQIENHPEWRWTDKQYEFKDRWWNATYKTRDAYLYLPIPPVFDADAKIGFMTGVTLGVRVRFGLDARISKCHFPDWTKVRRRDMLEFYDRAVAELEVRPEKLDHKPEEN